jgi:hypothetical protein
LSGPPWLALFPWDLKKIKNLGNCKKKYILSPPPPRPQRYMYVYFFSFYVKFLL